MKKKGVNILLVEDDPDRIELTANALKDNGVINRICVVKDGQEALDFLLHKGDYEDPEKAPIPGLILLDLKLPKVDGYEVLKKVKSDPKLKTIPVIILTTSAQEKDIALSYKNGVNSYICKPVKFEEFVKVIKKIKLYWILINKGPSLCD